MAGKAFRKLFVYVAAMWFTVASYTFRYQFMLAFVAVDAEQIMMLALIRDQHLKFFIVATSAIVRRDIALIFNQGRHMGLMATKTILVRHRLAVRFMAL